MLSPDEIAWEIIKRCAYLDWIDEHVPTCEKCQTTTYGCLDMWVLKAHYAASVDKIDNPARYRSKYHTYE